MDIVFVILNYNIVEETLKCVESIHKNIDAEEYRIVIVDNASKEAVQEKLEKKLALEDKVILYKNTRNLGFAKGNNIGIEIARKMEPRYICCLNNDTVLKQKDFLKNIDIIYNMKKPAVIGPKIRLKNGEIFFKNHNLFSLEYYKNWKRNIEKGKPIIVKLKEFCLKINVVRKLNSLRKGNDDEIVEDAVLHGCCLIFTPVFFDRLKGFDDRTFLYVEEELLYVELKKEKLKSIYYPKLEIYHLEDVSTKATLKTNKEIERFKNRCIHQSLEILIKELEDNVEVIYN